MQLLNELQKRKLVYQFTGKSLEELCSEARVAYIGMDATAPSIHAGYLIPIILGRILTEHGVKMIILLGGGTTRIGDPTGKSTARKVLDSDQIAANSKGLYKAIAKFFPGATVVNNAEWLDELSMMDFITEIANHVSVNALVKSEQFANRLAEEHPLSLMEITYPILQAYDFWHLHQKYGCNLQFGGSDQWSNILQGVELIRRKTGKHVHGLTCPLLLTSDGRKMGKSEQGVVWLDKDLFSAYDFWQYWRNIDDRDCERYLNLLLGESMPDADINKCKEYLATQLTAFVHGQDSADQARQTATELFSGGSSSSMPTIHVNQTSLSHIVAAAFELSNSDSKSLIKQGGIAVDGSVVLDPQASLSGEIVLCKGKKQYIKAIISM